MLNRIRPYPYRLGGWHPSVLLVMNAAVVAAVFRLLGGAQLPISRLVLIAGALAMLPYAVSFAGKILGLGRPGLAALYGLFTAGITILFMHTAGGVKVGLLPVPIFFGIAAGILAFVTGTGSGQATRS